MTRFKWSSPDDAPDSPPLMPAERTPMLHTVTRFWVTLLIIAVILYVSLLVISRTAGFRDLVRQRMEKVLGMPILVEQVVVSPALDLRITGVRDAAAATNRLPVLTVEHTILRWRFQSLLRGDGWPFRYLEVRDATLRFSPTAQGGWTPLPAVAAALLPWMTPAPHPATAGVDTPQVTEWLRLSGVRISCQNVRLVWMARDPEEPPAALAEGISFTTATVRPHRENILWSVLSVGHAQAEGREWLRDLRLEWVRLPDQDVILRIQGGWETQETGRP